MSFKWIGSAFLCSMMAFACGGGSGSGVDDDTLLVEVSAGEAEDICTNVVSAAPAFHEVDCGDGTGGTVGFETQADEDAAIDECVDDLTSAAAEIPDCTATVGELEDCFLALQDRSDQELCSDDVPPECDALFADPDCN